MPLAAFNCFQLIYLPVKTSTHVGVKYTNFMGSCSKIKAELLRLRESVDWGEALMCKFFLHMRQVRIELTACDYETYALPAAL
jgi:hypothetical protein